MIAKLQTFGLDNRSLQVLHNYLSDRKQRVKINNKYSSKKNIEFGVLQGSIFGPLLFNIFLMDLFLTVDNIPFASYADNTTPYMVGNSIENIMQEIEIASKKMLHWLGINAMKGSEAKCHLLSNVKTSAKMGNTFLQSRTIKNV